MIYDKAISELPNLTGYVSKPLQSYLLDLSVPYNPIAFTVIRTCVLRTIDQVAGKIVKSSHNT